MSRSDPESRLSPEEAREIRRERDRLRAIIDAEAKAVGWMGRLAVLVTLGTALPSAISDWLRSFRLHKTIPERETAFVLTAVVRRLIGVGIISALVAMIPIVLIVWQNVLIRRQVAIQGEQAEMAMRTQRLSVRPLLVVSGEHRLDPEKVDNPGIGWEMHNKGVGPAIVAWYEAVVDGEVVPSLHTAEFVNALDLPMRPSGFGYMIPSGSAYRAGWVGKLLWFPLGAFQRELMLKLREHRVEVRACYCSITDECWLVGTGVPVGDQPSCDPRRLSFESATDSVLILEAIRAATAVDLG